MQRVVAAGGTSLSLWSLSLWSLSLSSLSSSSLLLFRRCLNQFALRICRTKRFVRLVVVCLSSCCFVRGVWRCVPSMPCTICYDVWNLSCRVVLCCVPYRVVVCVVCWDWCCCVVGGWLCFFVGIIGCRRLLSLGVVRNCRFLCAPMRRLRAELFPGFSCASSGKINRTLAFASWHAARFAA